VGIELLLTFPLPTAHSQLPPFDNFLSTI